MHDAKPARPAPVGSAESHVFHRFPKVTMPRAVSGEGVYIVDDGGKRYIDASGGAAVSCLGHSHPGPIRAVQEQVERLAFAHTSFFTSDAVEELADLLVEGAPGDLDRVYLVSGGSEAVETALKLARQYCVEIGQPQRHRVISRRQSYHGNTLGALGAGGNAWRRATYEPLLAPGTHIAPCYAYRDRRDDETEFEYGQRVADELEQAILQAGPETVMCFLAETVAGATLGAVPAVEGYFRRIREICDRYGVLLILDEVMAGMGRTGTLYACEQEGVAPDLVCIAKGLGAGYQPVGAVVASRRIYDGIVSGSGFFQHGHTYSGHVTACAAAVAVQRAIREENLLENVRCQGDYLATRLTERFGNHRHVGNIRGRGLFMGLELVADRASKEPFDPSFRVAARLKAAALEHGLICYPMGGVLDGQRGDHALLAPPFIVTENQVDEIVDKLDASLASVLSDIS
ncbi:aspartate aminotransferase family protein [Kaustia mangrovi]|uniref:Aspartate aminotransferase family protein n=1 Tax=Kaustia mangrovi TaxID=2593653 RepID=A0A7S8C3I4_9HYPH|nr:aspartate aminotransferase family protein [Kaustia mangrovi]QPC42678.1 aspartate aminotransferase family protein [Kaustia mangrovi]